MVDLITEVDHVAHMEVARTAAQFHPSPAQPGEPQSLAARQLLSGALPFFKSPACAVQQPVPGRQFRRQSVDDVTRTLRVARMKEREDAS